MGDGVHSARIADIFKLYTYNTYIYIISLVEPSNGGIPPNEGFPSLNATRESGSGIQER